ncbi:MAG: enamine deaminase RidA [Rhodospirillaceae bacterium]|nr:enamine deaminase RidA [Rhodospirillaceae bacterium]
MAKIERFLVEGQHEPVSHYCHAVRCGDRLWISGTVGIASDGSVPEDTVDQFRVAMDNLDTVLRTAGGKPEDIVKVTVFLTDINDRQRINPLRQAYFGPHRPASTLVEISALVAPTLKVEIEAEAILDHE